MNTDALTAAIPVTVVAAASFDDMIAITGYTLFINLVSVTGLPAYSTVSRPASTPHLHTIACNAPRVPTTACTTCVCNLHTFCHLYRGHRACSVEAS